MSGRAYMRLCVRVSFPDHITETCCQTAYTHPSGGVDVPFGGYDLRPSFLPLILRRILTLLIADDKFSFGRYLAKRLLDCFHTIHTHPWGLRPST